MRAVCWNAKHDIRVETVPDPQIINPRDAILRVTSTAICGSDLHLYNGYIPMMKSGDILGHEFMGEIVDVGSEVKNLKIGDRIVVPFTIACGGCNFCNEGLYASCDNSNPNGSVAETLYGSTPSGMFGFSHTFGGYAGGQAEYVRIPYADITHFKVPEGLNDEKVLFLTDIFPTGYQAVKQAGIKRDDVVAIWGCGPVGQFAIRSAFMLGAGTVYAIDRYPARLALAEEGGAITINFEEVNPVEALHDLTAGRGADACIDCVGTEAFGHGFGAAFDWAKQLARMQTDRPNVLRQAIQACRKNGTVSVPGVYGGFVDGFNIGSAFSKGLELRLGQTHVQRHLPALMDHVQKGDIDPSFVISHRLSLDDAPEAYRMFNKKTDDCTKVVMKPGMA